MIFERQKGKKITPSAKNRGRVKPVIPPQFVVLSQKRPHRVQIIPPRNNGRTRCAFRRARLCLPLSTQLARCIRPLFPSVLHQPTVLCTVRAVYFFPVNVFSPMAMVKIAFKPASRFKIAIIISLFKACVNVQFSQDFDSFFVGGVKA